MQCGNVQGNDPDCSAETCSSALSRSLECSQRKHEKANTGTAIAMAKMMMKSGTPCIMGLSAFESVIDAVGVTAVTIVTTEVAEVVGAVVVLSLVVEEKVVVADAKEEVENGVMARLLG